jgi:hypothetical protein
VKDLLMSVWLAGGGGRGGRDDGYLCQVSRGEVQGIYSYRVMDAANYVPMGFFAGFTVKTWPVSGA